jgi:hypothetical protein
MAPFRDLGDRGGEIEAIDESGTLDRASGKLARPASATSRPWN